MNFNFVVFRLAMEKKIKIDMVVFFVKAFKSCLSEMESICQLGMAGAWSLDSELVG